jgi:hypothetical protein
MLKKYFLGLIVLVTISQANEEKWFIDLGWQISTPTTTGYYNSFDTSGTSGVHYDWEGTDDMLYAEIGRIFKIQESDTLLSLSAGTTFAILDRVDHLNMLFGKASVLYLFRMFNIDVKIGPKVKILLPYNGYYYDREDGVDARRVDYDTNSAFAAGIESIWGKGDWQMVTGLEYLTSAKYTGKYKDNNGHADAALNLNGLYFNIGFRYSF